MEHSTKQRLSNQQPQAQEAVLPPHLQGVGSYKQEELGKSLCSVTAPAGEAQPSLAGSGGWLRQSHPSCTLVQGVIRPFQHHRAQQ